MQEKLLKRENMSYTLISNTETSNNAYERIFNDLHNGESTITKEQAEYIIINVFVDSLSIEHYDITEDRLKYYNSALIFIIRNIFTDSSDKSIQKITDEIINAFIDVYSTEFTDNKKTACFELLKSYLHSDSLIMQEIKKKLDRVISNSKMHDIPEVEKFISNQLDSILYLKNFKEFINNGNNKEKIDLLCNLPEHIPDIRPYTIDELYEIDETTGETKLEQGLKYLYTNKSVYDKADRLYNAFSTDLDVGIQCYRANHIFKLDKVRLIRSIHKHIEKIFSEREWFFNIFRVERYVYDKILDEIDYTGTILESSENPDDRTAPLLNGIFWKYTLHQLLSNQINSEQISEINTELCKLLDLYKEIILCKNTTINKLKESYIKRLIKESKGSISETLIRQLNVDALLNYTQNIQSEYLTKIKNEIISHKSYVDDLLINMTRVRNNSYIFNGLNTIVKMTQNIPDLENSQKIYISKIAEKYTDLFGVNFSLNIENSAMDTNDIKKYSEDIQKLLERTKEENEKLQKVLFYIDPLKYIKMKVLDIWVFLSKYTSSEPERNRITVANGLIIALLLLLIVISLWVCVNHTCLCGDIMPCGTMK
ncbi:hypothetical protein NEIG_00375 [Nematocida sp. ERTm5]|nr:hypothetical protein NEIG_00375 [Nematocida sp. ERTm5]